MIQHPFYHCAKYIKYKQNEAAPVSKGGLSVKLVMLRQRIR